MLEKFVGLPGVEEYNLFTEEEYKQSSSVLVRLEGNETSQWHTGIGILLAFGSMTILRGMEGGTNICSKRQFNLVAPRLFINAINVQYKNLPYRVKEEDLRNLTADGPEWKVLKVLIEEVHKLQKGLS